MKCSHSVAHRSFDERVGVLSSLADPIDDLPVEKKRESKDMLSTFGWDNIDVVI